jgi:hypothetical protein
MATMGTASQNCVAPVGQRTLATPLTAGNCAALIEWQNIEGPTGEEQLT